MTLLQGQRQRLVQVLPQVFTLDPHQGNMGDGKALEILKNAGLCLHGQLLQAEL